MARTILLARQGQGGVCLSKGQQQRVALVQALLAMRDDRKILILHEFTSALDSETEEQILRNVQPWLAGRAVIIIAHRLSTVRKMADEIVVLDESGVVEEGSHAEQIARGGGYAEMARLLSVGTEEGLVAEPVAVWRPLQIGSRARETSDLLGGEAVGKSYSAQLLQIEQIL